MTIQAKIRVTGNVRCLWYRWQVKKHAIRLELTGNVEKGGKDEVIIIIEGEKPQIDEFILAIWIEHDLAQVKGIETTFLDKTVGYHGFELIKDENDPDGFAAVIIEALPYLKRLDKVTEKQS